MSAATSASTGQVYGVKRVCTAWELARSSYYAWGAERQDVPGMQCHGDRSAQTRPGTRGQ